MYGEKVVARYDPPQKSWLGGHHPPQHSQKLATMFDILEKLTLFEKLLYCLYELSHIVG